MFWGEEKAFGLDHSGRGQLYQRWQASFWFGGAVARWAVCWLSRYRGKGERQLPFYTYQTKACMFFGVGRAIWAQSLCRCEKFRAMVLSVTKYKKHATSSRHVCLPSLHGIRSIAKSFTPGISITLHLQGHTTTMRLPSLIFFASPAFAFSLPDVSSILPLFARHTSQLPTRDTKCPAVWNDVSKELTQKFLTAGQCNPDARAAIRLIFHDCGGKSQVD